MQDPDENEDPYLLLQECTCGNPRCGTVIIAMMRPRITEIADTGESACYVNFPLEHAQAFIDRLRFLGREQGVKLS